MDKKDKKIIEKRFIKRKQLFFYLKVFNKKTGKHLGHLADISFEGVMLSSGMKIDLDKTYLLEIDLDKSLEYEDNLIVKAKSIWSEKDANPEYIITGFKFIDIDQQSLDTIKSLIDAYGFMG